MAKSKEHRSLDSQKVVEVEGQSYLMQSKAQAYFLEVLSALTSDKSRAEQRFITMEEVWKRVNNRDTITYRNPHSLEKLMVRINTHLEKTEAPYRIQGILLGRKVHGFMIVSPEEYEKSPTRHLKSLEPREKQ